jgi:antitoxin Phd
MVVNTKNLVSIAEANENFSRVAHLVDETGSAIIIKNNAPRYIIIEFSNLEEEQVADDEDVLAISKRLMEKNRVAYEALAKL